MIRETWGQGRDRAPKGFGQTGSTWQTLRGRHRQWLTLGESHGTGLPFASRVSLLSVVRTVAGDLAQDGSVQEEAKEGQ